MILSGIQTLAVINLLSINGAYFIGPDELNYDSAKQYCNELGTSLAFIQDEQDLESAQNICNPNVCWIGLKRYNWIWTNDNGMTMANQWGFFHDGTANTGNGPWDNGQPSCSENSCGTTENCVAIRSLFNWKYNDVPCDGYYYHPLCNNITNSPTAQPTANPTDNPTTSQPTTAEPTTARPTTAEPTTAEPTTAEPITAEPITAEPTTAEPTTAEPTVAPIIVDSYFIGPTEVNYTSAREYCNELGTSLAYIENEQDLESAKALCEPNVCWVGLKRYNWTWSNDNGLPIANQWGFYDDGTAITGNGPWDNGQPSCSENYCGTIENCVAIRSLFNWKYNDVPCDGYYYHPLCNAIYTIDPSTNPTVHPTKKEILIEGGVARFLFVNVYYNIFLLFTFLCIFC